MLGASIEDSMGKKKKPGGRESRNTDTSFLMPSAWFQSICISHTSPKHTWVDKDTPTQYKG
jgi:hypothetical protein